jgi:hypothetical protein
MVTGVRLGMHLLSPTTKEWFTHRFYKHDHWDKPTTARPDLLIVKRVKDTS